MCHGTEVDGFLCQLHFPQAELFAGDDSKEGGEGHQTQTAHLNQQDNDDLPEPAPVRKGIIGDESGYTGGGSSGKQAVYQWCNLPGFGRDGQAEKNGAHQDHQGKTQTDYTQRLGKEGAFFTVLSPTAFYNNFRIHSFTLLSSANRSVREPDSSAHCAGRTYAAETFSHDLSDFYHSGR